MLYFLLPSSISAKRSDLLCTRRKSFGCTILFVADMFRCRSYYEGMIPKKYLATLVKKNWELNRCFSKIAFIARSAKIWPLENLSSRFNSTMSLYLVQR